MVAPAVQWAERIMKKIDNVFPLQGAAHMAEPTYEELKARVAELEKQKTLGSLQFRVGDKGGVSVYGLGRFPVTL
jgi:hypothetical protein